MSAFYNEHDAHAAQWLRNLISDGMIAPGIVDERSIVDLRPSDIDGFDQVHLFAGIGVWSYALRRAGWPDDRPVWTASFPCQPFSAAGKGDGFADERHLWPFGHHLIRVCRPPIIFGEQVASKDGLAWLDLVQADMEGTGYALGALDLCAAGFGAPHIRQRQYWMARRAGVALGDAFGSGLEGHVRHGDDRDQPGRVGTLAARSASATSAAFSMADAESFGRAGRQNDGDGGRRQLTSGQGCSLGGVDYAASARFDGHIEKPEGFARDETRLRVPGAGRGYDAERPDPTNGFWRASDWLGCTDGKWRPVEPGHVKVVNGPAFNVGCLRPNQETDEGAQINGGSYAIGPDAVAFLCTVRSADGAQTVSEWQDGKPEAVSPTQVLRSEVHGARDGEENLRVDQSFEDEFQSHSEGGVRNVWGWRRSSCASQGREPAQQRLFKLDDALSLMSQSRALAEFHGDWRTASALRALLEAINQERPVCDAFVSATSAWASLGEEAKDRLRVDFKRTEWVIERQQPLVDGASFKLGSGSAFEGKSRAKMLKGYGNAINAEQATEFIIACLNGIEGESV